MSQSEPLVRSDFYAEFLCASEGAIFSDNGFLSECEGFVSGVGEQIACFWACGFPIASGVGYAPAAQNLESIARALNSGNYKAIEVFDGPFLVVVFQEAPRRILIARDKFGLRSAYYGISDDAFMVSDGIESLNLKNTVRTTAVSEWLHYGAPLAPLTMFQRVYTIPPGAILEVSLNDLSVKTVNYFVPEDYVSAEGWRKSWSKDKGDLSREFRSVFSSAIKNCVGSQPKATILLSGGVDSSMLSAFARDHAEVTAVTVDIYGPGSESEVSFADLVARKLGIQLNVVRFGPREFIGEFCKTIRDLECPIIIENAVALSYVARSGALPRGQLIMDGEGADALMAGSTSLFKYSLIIRHLAKVAPLGTGTIRRLLGLLREVLAKAGMSTRTTLDGAGLDIDLTARRMELRYLEARITEKFSHLTNREDSEISVLMLREFYDYLVPLMLRIDRMSAVSGSHTVLPFLCAPVFNFLVNLDMSHKIGVRGIGLKPTTKIFLKSQLEDYLPGKLVYRSKVGFGIPAWTWVSFPERWRRDSWVGELFQIKTEALNHWIDNTKGRDRIFFLSLEVWGRIYGRGTPIDLVERDWLEHHDYAR